MLAEAVDEGVKAPPPQAPAKRAAAPSRPVFERLKGWLLFAAVDGRSEPRARANAPFEPRSRRGFILAALAPGLVLLLAAGAVLIRPLPGDPDTLSAIPIEPPSQTPAERKLIQNIAVLREGLWEAKLAPWSSVPARGLARVSNPDVHAALAALLGEIASFADAIEDRAPPGVHRDKVFLGQIADLRTRLAAIDAQLGGMRSVTAYHLGLLALWAGDAADAEPQFASVVDIARKTEPLDAGGRQRLDGIEASATYGLGLAEAARGAWGKAVGDFDAALAAACRAAADGKTNTQADFGFALGDADLVPLDTRSIRNDRLVALLRARGGNDEAARVAVTSPTCAELLSPSGSAPRGDADAEARALFPALSVAGDPTLAANLELRAALMGDGDVVQRLSFDGGDAAAVAAQSLARAIAGLEPAADAGGDGIDRSALADLQKISVLKARLAAQLRSATLSEPESDPAWNWSDPALFAAWKRAIAADVAAELLARAQSVQDENPGLAAALYGVVRENSSWLPATAVFDAAWRLNTGTSLGLVLWLVAIAAVMSAILFALLHRWRQTYRTTFESYHHADRLRAPEG
ncbi:MAG TPA: hypothetical protein VNU97_03515 [Rhizomicrobium sp.]|jgi:hypothetical protein|nr:hypothetical protein [Rhizomicrobium sp.]